MGALDWFKCLQLAVGAYAVAVAAFAGSVRVQVGGVMTWQAQALQLASAAALCAALVLSVIAYSRHPRPLGRRAAKAKKRAETAKVAENKAESERLRPTLKEWDRFVTAAGEAVHLFGELCGPGGVRPGPITDDEWRNWRDAILVAWKRASYLEKRPGIQAKGYLERLSALAPEDMFAGYITADEFNEWVMMQNAHYLALRRHVGLPDPDHGRRPA